MIAILLATALSLPPQKSDAVIGVTAIHLESGRRIEVRGNERFPMGSVYKFPIALEVLRQVDAGVLSLDRKVTIQPSEFAPGWSPIRDRAKGKPVTMTVGALIESMASVSDNTASDALLRLAGGPAAVSRRMTQLGFGTIRIDRSETEMAKDLRAPGGVARYAADPRDTTTPNAMADLLAAFWKGRDGLSKASHAQLVEHMTKTKTGARRIKLALPAGAVLIHKTGTMPGTTNDVGIIVSPDGRDHIAIAVFTKASKTEDEKPAETDIAAIARNVYSRLVIKTRTLDK